MNAQAFIDAGLHYIPHTFSVPLDYSNPAQGHIDIFAREVSLVEDKNSSKLGWLIFKVGQGFHHSPKRQ